MPTKSINHGILRRFEQNRIRPVINYYQPMQIHAVSGIVKGDQIGRNDPFKRILDKIPVRNDFGVDVGKQLRETAPKVLGIKFGDLASFKNDTSIHHISERQVEQAIKSVINRVPDVGHGLDIAKRFVPSHSPIPSGPKILGVIGQLHGAPFHPNNHMVNEGLEVAKEVRHVIGRFFHF